MCIRDRYIERFNLRTYFCLSPSIPSGILINHSRSSSGEEFKNAVETSMVIIFRFLSWAIDKTSQIMSIGQTGEYVSSIT